MLKTLAIVVTMFAALTAVAVLADPLDPTVLARDPYVAAADLDVAQLGELCTAADSGKALDSYAVATAKKAKGAMDFAEAAKTMVGLKGAAVTADACLATIQASGFVRGAYVEAVLLTCAVSEFLYSAEFGWIISNVDLATCH